MSEEGRLPAHLEVGGLLKLVQGLGGFGMVLQKGEYDAGSIVILTTHSGNNTRFWERMPQLDGSRRYTCTREQDVENPQEFDEYVARRQRQDPDCWFVELDGPDVERLIDSSSR
ncbi:DUF1491 family protein [Qipengyuania sp. 1NDH17]|uniref:DUF1491 family protein n=1 Tax=Qipengyuania polymorpha TaxID=2867234 RepID=A0ABS7IYU1_9SPHN|nr:DUF1491 family protein [Qipengyuania polymorpha]MBX7458732.1 DUF1491 family protein [Qipengyuania polymorpha]